MSTQREKAGSLALFSPKRGIPLNPSCDNGRNCRKSLTVIDHRWTTIEANNCGKGWLETWVATTAFERFHQRTFLATDIRSSPTMDNDIQTIATAQNILTDKTCIICLFYSSFNLSSSFG